MNKADPTGVSAPALSDGGEGNVPVALSLRTMADMIEQLQPQMSIRTPYNADNWTFMRGLFDVAYRSMDTTNILLNVRRRRYEQVVREGGQEAKQLRCQTYVDGNGIEIAGSPAAARKAISYSSGATCPSTGSRRVSLYSATQKTPGAQASVHDSNQSVSHGHGSLASNVSQETAGSPIQSPPKFALPVPDRRTEATNLAREIFYLQRREGKSTTEALELATWETMTTYGEINFKDLDAPRFQEYARDNDVCVDRDLLMQKYGDPTILGSPWPAQHESSPKCQAKETDVASTRISQKADKPLVKPEEASKETGRDERTERNKAYEQSEQRQALEQADAEEKVRHEVERKAQVEMKAREEAFAQAHEENEKRLQTRRAAQLEAEQGVQAGRQARLEAAKKAQAEKQARLAAEKAQAEIAQAEKIQAKKAQAEKARQEALQKPQAGKKAQQQAEEKARQEALQKFQAEQTARIEAKEKARLEDEKNRQEVERMRKLQAAEKAHREAHALARQENVRRAEAAKLEAERQAAQKAHEEDAKVIHENRARLAFQASAERGRQDAPRFFESREQREDRKERIYKEGIEARVNAYSTYRAKQHEKRLAQKPGQPSGQRAREAQKLETQPNPVPGPPTSASPCRPIAIRPRPASVSFEKQYNQPTQQLNDYAAEHFNTAVETVDRAHEKARAVEGKKRATISAENHDQETTRQFETEVKTKANAEDVNMEAEKEVRVQAGAGRARTEDVGVKAWNAKMKAEKEAKAEEGPPPNNQALINRMSQSRSAGVMQSPAVNQGPSEAKVQQVPAASLDHNPASNATPIRRGALTNEQKVQELEKLVQKMEDHGRRGGEERVAEQKLAAQKVAEQRAAEKKATEKKIAEQIAAEKKAAEHNSAEKKAAEDEAAAQRAANMKKFAEEGAAMWKAQREANRESEIMFKRMEDRSRARVKAKAEAEKHAKETGVKRQKVSFEEPRVKKSSTSPKADEISRISADDDWEILDKLEKEPARAVKTSFREPDGQGHQPRSGNFLSKLAYKR